MKVACALLVVVAMAVMSAAVAGEKKVTLKDLPAAVQKTVLEQSKGATLKEISKETENGKAEYEAELVANGHSRDVLIAPDGQILAIEEEIALASAPSAVRAAVEQHAAKRKILGLESITEHGAIVAYEAHIKDGLKKIEVKFSPDGKIIK